MRVNPRKHERPGGPCPATNFAMPFVLFGASDEKQDGAATGRVWSNRKYVEAICREMIVRDNRAILCDPVVKEVRPDALGGAAEVGLSLSEVFEPQNAPG